MTFGEGGIITIDSKKITLVIKTWIFITKIVSNFTLIIE